MKTGILLINLGTPAAPTKAAVKSYLSDFLMDPYVVDLPFVLRWLLVKGIILRTRPQRSVKAYQQIWSDAGSPLLLHSVALRDALCSSLGEHEFVAIGMRYGQPSIAEALHQLSHCQRLVVLPLFPQYSLAATESALNQARLTIQQSGFAGEVTYIEDFFQDPGFIAAWVELIQQYACQDFHTLFSYHGLPVKQLDKVADCANQCTRQHPCPTVQVYNRRCYRAQCYATTQAIVGQMGWSSDQYSVAFQSRLGKLPWIQPYTDEILPTLISQGVTRLQVVCPAFVADCLETLEEIGLRAKQQWRELGGAELKLIPCLNASAAWLRAITGLLQD